MEPIVLRRQATMTILGIEIPVEVEERVHGARRYGQWIEWDEVYVYVWHAETGWLMCTNDRASEKFNWQFVEEFVRDESLVAEEALEQEERSEDHDPT